MKGKRSMSVLLAVLTVCFAFSAMGEQMEFAFDNGLRFGMSRTEVQSVTGGTRGRTSVWQIGDTDCAYYYDRDGSLNEVIYLFLKLDSYRQVERKLTELYGPTDWTASSGNKLPDVYFRHKVSFGDGENSYREVLTDYSERLLPAGNGQYVYISHQEIRVDFNEHLEGPNVNCVTFELLDGEEIPEAVRQWNEQGNPV